jgi:hypothetical protein
MSTQTTKGTVCCFLCSKPAVLMVQATVPVPACADHEAAIQQEIHGSTGGPRPMPVPLSHKAPRARVAA